MKVSKHAWTPVVAGGLLATLVAAAHAQLSGPYTIDPNGSGPRNYASMAAAVSALAAGVSGPVDFRVAAGTHGRIELRTIPGTSPSNRITFRGTPGATTIDAMGSRAAIRCISGAQHVRFESFTLTRFASFGVEIEGIFGPTGNIDCHDLVILAPATPNFAVRAITMQETVKNRFVECIVRGGGHSLYGANVFQCEFDRCEFDGLDASNSVVALFGTAFTIDTDNVFRNCFIHSPGPTHPACDFDNFAYGSAFWNNTVITNSSHAAVAIGGWGPWANASTFRNNIVVNLGTGAALRYLENGQPSSLSLPAVDVSHNCYWTPVSSQPIETRRGFRGSLAAWRTLLGAFPNLIPAGGNTIYDATSIEADPKLGAVRRPFNIHLTTASPAIDGGTSTYIAGPYMTLPANTTVPDDVDRETRTGSVDIGADEAVAILRGTGPTAPGTTHGLALSSVGDAGLPYQVVTSSGIGPIAFAGKQLGLGLDPLFFATITNAIPTVFVGYAGFLDQSSNGSASIAIPAIPQLTGQVIRNAFLVGDPRAPFGIKRVSGTYEFVVR